MPSASSAPSANRSHPSSAAVILAVALVYVVWGSTYLGIKFALADYPPFLLGGIRMGLAGVTLFAIMRWRGVALPTRAQWGRLVWLGVLMVLLSNGLVNLAETQVSSGIAAVAVASMPLFGGLFAWMRGVKPTALEWLGLIIGFSGVIWLNIGSDLLATPLGMICLIIASISWAWGSVWSRDQDLPAPFMSAACQMMTGSAWMFLAALLTGERFAGVPSMHATLAMLYLVVFGSIIAFTAYIWLNQNVRPALAHSYAYVNPPIAVMFGVLLAGERITPSEVGAMVVILAGVVIITMAKVFRPKPATAS